MSQTPDFTLFTATGERKYLTPEERQSFASMAKKHDRETRTFCLMMNNTGLRISEGLSLSASSIDLETKSLTVETLKKRKKGIYRQIPLSDEFLDDLNLVHEIRSKQKSKKGRNMKLWDWSRMTGFRRINSIMEEASISGAQACPKGLRHGFAVWCIMQNIPLPSVQKWLGHSSMVTTSIYMQVMGKEERELASRLWQ